MDEELTSQLTKNELSVDTLLQLLTYCEGEIQARDIVIATLKAEKTKQLWYEAKYGQLAGCNPIKALQRDSSYVDDENEVDESSVGQMYETQLLQLEKLISVQRRCHVKSKQILAAAERRHARILRELDEEKKRTAADVAQGDDLCVLLENERTRLRQQFEYEQRENERVQKEVEKLEKKLLDEKERHKSMVLFLINERKQMLLGLHEMRLQNESGKPYLQEESLISEMKKEVSSLRLERDQLRAALETTRTENQGYKEVIRNQEEDLALMRNSILINTRNYNNNLRMSGDGCVVVVNKAVSTVVSSSKNYGAGSVTVNERHAVRPRLCNSSTFPASERSTPSRVPLPTSSRSSSTMPPSPTKKGFNHHSNVDQPTSLSAMRLAVNPAIRDKDRMINFSEISEKIKNSYTGEPEIDHLNAVIESMNSTISEKRSASLPRNGKKPGSALHKATSTSKNANSAIKRCTIFKALGVTNRNDRNGT